MIIKDLPDRTSLHFNLAASDITVLPLIRSVGLGAMDVFDVSPGYLPRNLFCALIGDKERQIFYSLFTKGEVSTTFNGQTVYALSLTQPAEADVTLQQCTLEGRLEIRRDRADWESTPFGQAILNAAIGENVDLGYASLIFSDPWDDHEQPIDVNELAAPADDTPAPGEVTDPMFDMAAPVEDVNDTPAPVDDYAAPADEMTAPELTTTADIPEDALLDFHLFVSDNTTIPLDPFPDGDREPAIFAKGDGGRLADEAFMTALHDLGLRGEALRLYIGPFPKEVEGYFLFWESGQGDTGDSASLDYKGGLDFQKQYMAKELLPFIKDPLPLQEGPDGRLYFELQGSFARATVTI